MGKYDEYKDSGVDFIGNIPSRWKTLSFRYWITVLTDYTANGSFASLAENVNYLDSGYSRLVRLTDLRVNFENDGVYVNQHAHEFLRKSELFGGEILIANVGAYAGLVCIMPHTSQKMTLGPNMFLIKTNVNERYAYYLLSSYPCQEQLKLFGISSAQPKLNKDDIREIKVLQPSVPEQAAIASYLDRKTKQIDDLIAKKDRLIELKKEERAAIINQAVTKGLDPDVPMKDSGIEWLGEIPEHWEIILTRRIVKEHKQGYYSSDDYTEGGIKLLRITDIDDNSNILYNNCPHYILSEAEYGPYIIKVGDFVFARSGTIGRFGWVRETDNKTIFASYLINFRFKEECESGFLRWIFQSYYFRESLISQLHGGANQNIHAENIKQQIIAIPPHSEQEAIATFLDHRTEQIDSTITRIHKQINLLKEYKTTLISEAVIGKIKVS